MLLLLLKFAVLFIVFILLLLLLFDGGFIDVPVDVSLLGEGVEFEPVDISLLLLEV